MGKSLKSILGKILSKDILYVCVDSKNDEYKVHMQKSVKENKQYSSALVHYHPVTNRQICEILDPLHNEVYKCMRLEDLESCMDIKCLSRNMKQTLLTVDNVVMRSCGTIGCFHMDYESCNHEFFRPISARQADRAEAVLSLLKVKHFGSAFHELYDVIDDFGFQYKKWNGEYKIISCNEAILFHILFLTFVNALEEEYSI